MNMESMNLQEKLPKLSKDNTCVVPLIENKVDKSNEANKKFNQSIPDDLILCLKQAEQPKEFLGPPTKRTLQSLNKNPSVIKRCDNAWNFEKQREKFSFLTKQPVCSCGAGKDISFIYDCVVHKGSQKKFVSSNKFDVSEVRAAQRMSEMSNPLSDSLIPDEFRIVKNLGVWPLKSEEEEYTTTTEDHSKHFTIFPSLKPTGRNEVIQLKHTMDALLKRVGADAVDPKGPTQLHNLLEIIKQEQNIYNVVFYEVIRQVTVECKERGEILSKLRERYANLLSRVPSEIKSLHEEIMAQRALDRRLTEELMQFKTTIEYLTDELSSVKQHDKFISQQAAVYQKDLSNAVEEAQQNAMLLNEYHEIYELQRKRLEKALEEIADERELWIQSAYNIALKITEENKLVTAKRVNLSEKSWSKLAKHFALFICDHDTKDLVRIQKLTDTWKNSMDEIRDNIAKNERDSVDSLALIKGDIERLRGLIVPVIINKQGDFVDFPNVKTFQLIITQIKKIQHQVTAECDKLNSDFVTVNEEQIKKCEKTVKQLVELCNTTIGRHKEAKDQEKIDKYMKYHSLQYDMNKLHQEFRNRLTGETGFTKVIFLLSNQVDLILQKFNTANEVLNEDNTVEKNNKVNIYESDVHALLEAIDDWTNQIDKTTFDPRESSQLERENSNSIDKHADQIAYEELFNDLNKWLTVISHHIDTQDSVIVDNATLTHTKMIHWMVQALIRLAPDHDDISEEAKNNIYASTDTVEQLTCKANELIQQVVDFTDSSTGLVKALLAEQSNDITPEAIESQEQENKCLVTFQSDCREWIYSIKLLIRELDGKHMNRNYMGFGRPTNRASQKAISQAEKALANDESDAMDMSQEFDNKSMTENTYGLNDITDGSNDFVMTKNTASFEILAEDTNTQRKFLENINFNDTNHLSEAELKNTAYNALNTINKLQKELIESEERAQISEVKTADLDFKLKEALSKIRQLEKKVMEMESIHEIKSADIKTTITVEQGVETVQDTETKVDK